VKKNGKEFLVRLRTQRDIRMKGSFRDLTLFESLAFAYGLNHIFKQIGICNLSSLTMDYTCSRYVLQ